MDAKTLEILIKKLNAAHEEIRVLYEMSEAEMLLFRAILMELPFQQMSPKLASKMFRAMGHLFEHLEDIGTEVFGEKYKKG